MAEPPVRVLRADEILDATNLVGRAMLTDTSAEVQQSWADQFEPERTHGAFSTSGELAGVVRWFEGDLSVPGGAVPAGLVSAVAVAPTHRRQGHLSRMMRVQLDAIAAEERAVATLIAAEWPIYGRFGYGPSIEACTWAIDTLTATFVDDPTGTIELVEPATLRPHLEAVHDQHWARSPGAVTRRGVTWERLAGVVGWPGSPFTAGLRRGALWRDHTGEVAGAVSYSVKEVWTDNRPRGVVEVSLLVGATAEAERELWRHLCESDWISTVTAEGRSVDDPIGLFLTDGRAAVQRDRFDCIWSRILDVPATFAAYRSAAPRAAVVEVVDELGYANGRWRIEIGPDGSQATSTDTAADVRLTASALGALHLGGSSVGRLQQAGWIDEETSGGIDRATALFATPVAPWSPTHY
jgi:predicted acetyltransferase